MRFMPLLTKPGSLTTSSQCARKGFPRNENICEPPVHDRYQYGELYREREISCRASKTRWLTAERDWLYLDNHRSGNPIWLARAPHAHGLHSAIEGFLGKIQVLPWGREEATVYGDLRAKLEASGKTLGTLDMLIAAHAMAVDAVLVSNDQAFSHVRDLPGCENWATDL